MTDSPFAADAVAAMRLATLANEIGDAFAEAVAGAAIGDISHLPPDVVAGLVRSFGLQTATEAAILALPAASRLARPPISGYRVGAVGLARDGGLVLGGNLEFPGASIHHTVHAEGFVTLRARALGIELVAIAIREARPCAHCRQVLAEMTWAGDLRIVDPLGHDLGLRDLYPWPFAPADLGAVGVGECRPAGTEAGQGVSRVVGPVPPPVAAALVVALGLAHAPYSGEPSACVLGCAGGRFVTGAVLESVAFNPTIGPLQDALVGVAAAGLPHGSIEAAWLAVAPDARVDHAGPTRELLAAVAPRVPLEVTYWA